MAYTVQYLATRLPQQPLRAMKRQPHRNGGKHERRSLGTSPAMVSPGSLVGLEDFHRASALAEIPQRGSVLDVASAQQITREASLERLLVERSRGLLLTGSVVSAAAGCSAKIGSSASIVGWMLFRSRTVKINTRVVYATTRQGSCGRPHRPTWSIRHTILTTNGFSNATPVPPSLRLLRTDHSLSCLQKAWKRRNRYDVAYRFLLFVELPGVPPPGS